MASGKHGINEALLKKIAGDMQQVLVYKTGHVVAGRVQLEGTDNPDNMMANSSSETNGSAISNPLITWT